ncbi:MAG TPA: hypothetical protein VFQ47_02980 [Nitrososphaera sp.]|nr:hypothetical protein [Nitrososphaera sp.]
MPKGESMTFGELEAKVKKLTGLSATDLEITFWDYDHPYLGSIPMELVDIIDGEIRLGTH